MSDVIGQVIQRHPEVKNEGIPELRPISDTVKSTDLVLELGDGKPFVVPVSGKAYRRAMRQVEELAAGGGEVIVLLQGRLVAGHRIEGAGLSVQARTPKAEA